MTMTVEFEGNDFGTEAEQVVLLRQVSGNASISRVSAGEGRVVDPLSLFVIFALVGASVGSAAMIAMLIVALNKAFRPFTTVDLRDGGLKVKVRPGVPGRRGETMIIGDTGTWVELKGNESLETITKVVADLLKPKA